MPIASSRKLVWFGETLDDDIAPKQAFDWLGVENCWPPEE